MSNGRGRRNLGVVHTAFTLCQEHLEWIDSHVTINKNRSVFIRELLDEKMREDAARSNDKGANNDEKVG